MRRQEFAASCAILQVSRPILLNYPDGQLYRLELNQVVYDLTRQVRQFRPHVLLTFGPDGGVTGHADHSMAGVFAALAYHWAGRANRYRDQFDAVIKPYRPQKLYYATADFGLPGREPISLPPTTTVVDIGEHLETKITAFKAHRSQAPLWPIFEQHARGRGNREMFHLAAAIKPGLDKLETDLLERVEESE